MSTWKSSVPSHEGSTEHPICIGHVSFFPGHEIIGGAEEQEEGTVDGVVGGSRVGKERLLPHNRMKIDLL